MYPSKEGVSGVVNGNGGGGGGGRKNHDGSGDERAEGGGNRASSDRRGPCTNDVRTGRVREGWTVS